MIRHLIRPSRPVVGLFMALLLLAGCSGPGGSSPFDDHAITLNDTSASKLDIVLQIAPGQTVETLGGFQVVALYFVSRRAPMDTQVQLTNNEAMSCDGVKLTRAGTLFRGGIPTVPPGQAVTCTYSSHGAQAVIAYTIPPDLFILTPHLINWTAKVRRSKDFAVTYQPVAAENGTVSVIAETRGNGNWNPFDDGSPQFSGPQPGTGTCHFDITHARTGPGRLQVFREFDVRPPGSPFHSLTIAYIEEAFFFVTVS